MGGINSLSGLYNVNVDFRPTIDTNVQNTGNDNQLLPEDNALPEAAPQPQQATAKSVVRQLDVLLLNAAGKSLSADAAEKVRTTTKSLFDKGILTKEEEAKLDRLAADASEKLRALDRFSGRDLAKALMKDKETGETVWSKGFFGLSSAAKAVKSAIEAQQKLSEKLGEFTDRLARAPEEVVDVNLQEQYTELQFQCDRRASEIISVLYRMYDLSQQDVVAGAAADPQTKALLDATFKELMPREAILMHGTAEAFETLNKHMADQMRPLAQKLDAFAADPAKFLDKKELGALRRDMATMKNAIANVRANGIEITHTGKDGNTYVTRTEVDKSLLDAMDKVLDEASQKIGYAKATAVSKAREAFLKDVGANLSPLDAPGAAIQSSNALLSTLMIRKNELVRLLHKFAMNQESMDKFDQEFDACAANYGRDLSYDIERGLLNAGVEPTLARSTARAVNGLHLIKAQFKAMMESTARVKNDDAFGLAASDVRKIMLGEKGISNVVQAKALGFKAEDVDPATEELNIADSRPLGAGQGGKTYLLTTKQGGEFVFKPELDGRIGLSNLSLGSGAAYLDKQKTANLNLATQETAKIFGCEDLVVKYSVGSHDGQFGIFMEKAKGVSGEDFVDKKGSGGGGIAPADLQKITDPRERAQIQGAIAQKLSRLQWLDLITGQGDRHHGNYFVCVEKNAQTGAYDVTVKGIDNDASFSSRQVGLQKYALDQKKAAEFDGILKKVCENVLGRGWKGEHERRVSRDPAITRNADGTMTVDLEKAQTPEIKMAILETLGPQSVALPEEIDEDFYEKLMEMDRDPAQKQAFLDTIAPRISPAALAATRTRLDEAIAHAKKLKEENQVYGNDQWRSPAVLSGMAEVPPKVTITKSDGKKVDADTKIWSVNAYRMRNCPALYKRDFFHMMFYA